MPLSLSSPRIKKDRRSHRKERGIAIPSLHPEHKSSSPIAAHAHGTEAIKMAVKAGVSSIEHGSMLDDEAIRAATVNAADLIGNVRIGQLRPGAFADIIAVKIDPLKDIRALENVAFVMKGGTVYKTL